MTKLSASTSNLKKLTIDQGKALEAFSSWLDNSNDYLPFVLSGFAGSGKTFLSMRFLQLVEAKELCWTVVAPTHKAVGVLRIALTEHCLKPTWYPSTIHRLLRLKLKRKGDLEVCEETENTKDSLEQLGLVLIDESSMIDSKLLRIVLECASIFKTRIVFVGDPAQLPPIGEVESSVFSLKRSVNMELNEVVRHQGPVLQLASGIRNRSISCNSPPCLPLVKTSKGVVGCLDKTDWLRRAKQALRSAAERDQPDEARILCYTNRSLEKLVPHARRAIHGEMADQMTVLPGEIVISRRAVMAPSSYDGTEEGEEPDMLLGSNRELMVRDVRPEKCNLLELGLINDDDWQPPTIDTLVAKVSAGELELNLRLLPPVGSNGRILLDETLSRLRLKAKGLGKQEGRLLWKKFFFIRDSFASLGPASVLTIHRSQGSTFGDVFVSPDVFFPNDLVFRRQLLYVAVSRAQSGVWLVGDKAINSLKSSWNILPEK